MKDFENAHSRMQNTWKEQKNPEQCIGARPIYKLSNQRFSHRNIDTSH